MLAVCVPWLPGSSRFAPSDVMVMPPFGWVPLALNWPIGPLLLCVVKLFHMLWLSPPVIPMPGMIFISSAASRPTIERFSIMFLFNVWLACPESTGTTTSAPATTSTSCFVDWTWRTTVGKANVAPCVRTMPCSSKVCKPAAVTVTVYEPGGMDGKLKNPALFVTLSQRAPVASFFRTPFAAGTTAPVASVTVAPNDPLENCANTGSCETAKAAISNPNNQKEDRNYV